MTFSLINFGLKCRFRSYSIPFPQQTRSAIAFSQSRALGTSSKSSPGESLTPAPVKLPDLFERWMSRSPLRNQNYERVTYQSVNWIALPVFPQLLKIHGYDQQQTNKLHSADFGYWPAIIVPEVKIEPFRLVVDSILWVFVFDDQLDEGPIGRDSRERLKYTNDAIDILRQARSNRPPSSGSQPTQMILTDILRRLMKNPNYPIAAVRRWSERQLHYIESVQTPLNIAPSEQLEDSLQRYMKYKRDINGIPPIFSAVEWSVGLRIPDEVFKHPAMMELERIGQDMETLVNDTVSYHREKQNGYDQNIISVLGHHGFSEQESYHKIQELLRDCFKAWYMACAELPSWGEEVDRDVERYIKGIQDVVLGLAHFSFRTERYFGVHREHVRQTRELKFGDAKTLIPASTNERKEDC